MLIRATKAVPLKRTEPVWWCQREAVTEGVHYRPGPSGCWCDAQARCRLTSECVELPSPFPARADLDMGRLFSPAKSSSDCGREEMEEQSWPFPTPVLPSGQCGFMLLNHNFLYFWVNEHQRQLVLWNDSPFGKVMKITFLASVSREREFRLAEILLLSWSSGSASESSGGLVKSNCWASSPEFLNQCVRVGTENLPRECCCGWSRGHTSRTTVME